MRRFLHVIAAVSFLAFSLSLAHAAGDVELAYTPSAVAVKTGEEFTVDVMVKNPNGISLISARAWLQYDSSLLEGVSVDTKESAFTLSAPGEDGFDAAQGYVMIGRSNITGGSKEPEAKLATVRFRVKTQGAVVATLKPYDYQITELGHTSVNIIEQGFPVNVLSKEPETLLIGLNGAVAGQNGSTGSGAQPVEVTPAPAGIGGAPTLPPLSLLRPTGLKVNTGAGYVDLKWDSAREASRVGYNLYYGKTSGQYSRRRTVGDVNGYRLDGLNTGETYYFAVTAYDAFNRESDYSNEVGIIVGEPLSSTSPFEGVFERLLARVPVQPQNGPLTWWALGVALISSAAFLAKRQQA